MSMFLFEPPSQHHPQGSYWGVRRPLTPEGALLFVLIVRALKPCAASHAVQARGHGSHSRNLDTFSFPWALIPCNQLIVSWTSWGSIVGRLGGAIITTCSYPSPVKTSGLNLSLNEASHYGCSQHHWMSTDSSGL